MASRLTGSWGKVSLLVNNLPKDLKTQAERLQESEAQRIANDIKNSLFNQTLNHVDIKQATKDGKNSSKILIETGELANSISVIDMGDKIYITPQGNHHSGLSANELATIHEFGTDRVPPRPFIRPVYEDNKAEVVDNFEDLIENVIAKYK